jgi:chemotaxis protein MotB
VLAALALSAGVSQSTYDALGRENQKLRAENQQLVAQVMALEQEATFVEAGDFLFPAGGFELSQAGRTDLHDRIVPKLRGLQNAKIVVNGSTDDTPVGAALRRQGIDGNLALSSRRAGAVVAFSDLSGGLISTPYRLTGSATRTRWRRTIRPPTGQRTGAS